MKDKFVFYGTIMVVFGFLILAALSRKDFDFIQLFEWVTRYILPWIALYWFIRYVKGKKA